MQEYKKSTWEKYNGFPKSYKGSGILTTTNNNDIPLTFTPIKINNLTLKNRIVVSPMCQYSCNDDGIMTDWHLSHYGSLAKGGASLIIFESTAVQREGRITFGDAGIWNDEQIVPLKRIVDMIHQLDAHVGIQLSHAGRKASTVPPFLERSRNSIFPDDESGLGWQVVGPSEIRFSEYMMVPKEMSIQDIKDTIEAFKQSAIRSIKAGFDLIEIHAAHGYLINQFLSSSSNKRTDQYGGSFENRIRLLLEVIESVRSVWPLNKPLIVRLSCVEWVEDGWNMDETLKLVQILKDLNTIDLIDCSSGGNNVNQKIKVEPMYQTPFADQVKSILNSSSVDEASNNNNRKILVSTVGQIKNGLEIESILKSNKSDLVMCGRSFLSNPNFPYSVASELKVRIDYQLQMGRARD